MLNNIIIEGMVFALPLFIMAIGGIYCERSGITNLAVEGLQGMGAFVGALAATLVSGYFAADSQMPMYIAMLFAMIGGGTYAILHAVLCIKFKADQVISGVVINILAMALTTFLASQINASFFGEASSRFILGTSVRFTVPYLSEIPVLGAVFQQMYPFEIIIAVIALLSGYLMTMTPFGLRLRACGDNPHAVDAAGVQVAHVRFVAVVISGALSGLGGMCFAYSISAQFSSAIYMGYGYLAIAALIFGNWKIFPTFGACLIFGIARSSGFAITSAMALPVAYSDLFMILPYIVTLVLLVFFSGSNRAPRALGEIYDKGKR